MNFIEILKIVCNYIKNHINELRLFINIIFNLPHNLKSRQYIYREVKETYLFKEEINMYTIEKDNIEYKNLLGEIMIMIILGTTRRNKTN